MSTYFVIHLTCGLIAFGMYLRYEAWEESGLDRFLTLLVCLVTGPIGLGLTLA